MHVSRIASFRTVTSPAAHGGPDAAVERLNGTTFEQLRAMSLSVSQARRVLAYRERSGTFKSVDELDAIPGLPRALLGQLKYKLTGVPVDPTPAPRRSSHAYRALESQAPRDVAVPRGSARSSSKATWAWACGLVGLFVIPLVFSTLAIVLGARARRDIRQDPGLVGKSGATAGIVLGVLGLAALAYCLLAGPPGGGARPS